LRAADQRKREKIVERPAGGFAPAAVSHAETPKTPPDLKRHVVEDLDLTEVFPYINPQMLYVRHLGFKGKYEDALAAGDEKALELHRAVEDVENEVLRRDDIRASAVYQFFGAAGKQDSLVLLGPDGKSVIGGFELGRQQKDGGLCLSDYVAPLGSGTRDFIAMFATTIGPGVRELSERWKHDGDYLRSHILAALALEAAEGLAELLHERIRRMWGIGDPPETTKKDLFQARYHGVRVSFGYPACPRLEDQAELFRLLDPTAAIGVELTEGFMMDPESSVSALVFQHPEAGYFSLSEADQQALEVRLAETHRAAGV
jgi:5-methyltetrahydrofolate--homocysteine methyltransferase